MQRKSAARKSEPAKDGNPFKRRGPGAAHAAPLAYSAVQGKHGTAIGQSPDAQVKTSEENRPGKQARIGDEAGPSAPALASPENMQSGLFPRCRISSVLNVENTSVRRTRGSHGPFVESGKEPGRKHARLDTTVAQSPADGADMKGQCSDEDPGAVPSSDTPKRSVLEDTPVSSHGHKDSRHEDTPASSHGNKGSRQEDAPSPNTDADEDVVPNAVDGKPAVPGTSATMLTAPGPAAARPAVPVADSAGCAMPEPPPESQVPGLALRYTLRTDDDSVRSKQSRLKAYQQKFNSLRDIGRAKPDLVANAMLRKADPLQPYLGHPLGVSPGDVFEGRGELEALGIHGRTLLGIDAQADKPACAICMSGGYVDDEDTGTEVWYTGMGGQKGKRQVKAQELKNGNLSLKISMDMQTPVRVCRAAAMQERDGHSYRMYAYEGLYLVKEMAYVKSKDGPEVYKFKLIAVAGHAVASATVKYNHFGGSAVMARRVLKPAKPAKSAKTSVKTGPRKPKRAGSGSSKGKPAHKPGKGGRELKWRWDNTAAEMRELEKRRWAGHGWSGAKAQAGLLRDDISGGSERVRIALVNDSGQEAPEPDFTYRRDYTFSPSAVVYMSELFCRKLVQWSGSKATGHAAGTLPDFTSEHSVLYNQESGMLERIQFTPCMEDRPTGQPQLLDVASRGIFLPLQVFYTANKGWGVRCEVDLPIGTFVCCYIGRVCTNSEANELRGRDEYIFDLNHFESVAQHLAENPGDATKEELRLLPRLPPEDFFSWASEIPRVEGDPASLPSVQEVVRKRGFAKQGDSMLATGNGVRGNSMAALDGQDAHALPMSNTVPRAGAGMNSPDAKNPSTSISGKSPTNARTDWEDIGGQISADAAKVLHECRQAHGEVEMMLERPCLKIAKRWQSMQ